MKETVDFLSTLRALDVKLWVEGERLRCSAPAGALSDELRAALTLRKDKIIVLVRLAEARKVLPPTVVPIKPDGNLLPLFAVSGHGGDVFWLLALARLLDADQPVFGVQPPGLDGSEPLRTVEALARFEVEQIRRVQPNGPYLIAGHCAGGAIAFEVAQQLTSAGEEVALVALIGSPYPSTFRKATQMRLQLRRHLLALSTGSFLERNRYVISKLQGRRRKPDVVAEVDPNVTAARARVESATVDAVRAYVPQFYAHSIDLFVARDEWHRPDRWRAVAKTSREHSVGSFYIDDLMLGSHVEVLAKSIQARITEVHSAIEDAGRAPALR